MNLAKNAGLELPVYPVEDVAWSSYDIRMAARSGTARFTRYANIRYEGLETRLNAILKISDQILDAICDITCTEQIDHSWGLVPVTGMLDAALGEAYKNMPFMPKGYGLVADVEVVQNSLPIDDHWSRHISSREPEWIAVETERGEVIRNLDIHSGQFVLKPSEGSTSHTPVLVDIEPWLRVTDAPLIGHYFAQN